MARCPPGMVGQDEKSENHQSDCKSSNHTEGDINMCSSSWRDIKNVNIMVVLKSGDQINHENSCSEHHGLLYQMSCQSSVSCKIIYNYKSRNLCLYVCMFQYLDNCSSKILGRGQKEVQCKIWCNFDTQQAQY